MVKWLVTMSVNLDTTEPKAEAIKLSGNATWLIEDTFKLIYRDMPTDLGIDIEKRMREIADDWAEAAKYAPAIADLQNTAEELKDLAEKQGKTDEAQQMAREIEDQKSKHVSLGQRRVEISQNELMADLLGAELLRRYEGHPELAGEPLIIQGADYITKVAKESLDLEQGRMKVDTTMAPNVREFAERLHTDVEGGLRDLNEFVEKIKERQIAKPAN
jgi:predicted outer membrane protein